MTPDDLTDFPTGDWQNLLQALCQDDVSGIGPSTPGEPLSTIAPTRYSWLKAMRWRPVRTSFGIALLELAEPGKHPASAWEPICGPLVLGPAIPGAPGATYQGILALPGTGRRAAVYLTTTNPADDLAGRVTAVQVRIDPDPPHVP